PVLFKNPYIKNQALYIESAVQSVFKAIKRVEEKEYYPVSAAQKRMVTLNRFAPDSVNYNMPGALTIEWNVEAAHFEKAFQKLVNRHESLRTSFHFIHGEPVQRIHKNITFELQNFESDETKKEQEENVLTQFLRPFDLERAPLLRAALVRQEENKYIFLYDMHHVISDGQSMGILEKEFSALYAGRQLPPLRLQYKDYAAWQNRFMASDKLVKQKKYWQEKFAGEIPLLKMPADYPRPAIQSFEGETISFEVDEKLTGNLNRQAGDHGATLYMTLLAIYSILLSKYSGQQDIIVGSPSAGRRHTDLESIIGMFVNTLTMRNAPQSEKTFPEYLKEVKQNALEVFENQDY
ncbi:MAG: non-ribosomal peptide synthetase, partial [bacterium]|nr:non-ribosomal peptide synthetase [bacterium]